MVGGDVLDGSVAAAEVSICTGLIGEPLTKVWMAEVEVPSVVEALSDGTIEALSMMTMPMSAKSQLTRFLHGEADFESNPKMADFATFDMSAGLGHLEPPQMMQGLVGADDGTIDGVFNAIR